MLEKYFESKIPDIRGKKASLGLLNPGDHYENLWIRVEKSMLAYNPRTALVDIWATLIVFSNRLIENCKPWELAKDPAKREELERAMWVLAEHLAHAAVLIVPFLPATAKKILSRLQLPTQWVIKDGKEFMKPLLKAGTLIERGGALFPKLEEKE
jgi:methionyl-tRNA synthetase